MNVWIITKDRRDQIPWWRLHLYAAGTVILFGMGSAMGVLAMRPALAGRAIADRAAHAEYTAAVAALETENVRLKETVNSLAKDYLASIMKPGQQMAGYGDQR